jgi:lysine 2,3-aminomutase
LKHLEDIGENISEYESIWGYSLGETEKRSSIYEYPQYDFKVTSKMTNLDVG